MPNQNKGGKENFWQKFFWKTPLVAVLFVVLVASGVFITTAVQAVVSNIHVTIPDGGEFWRGTQTVEWTASGDPGDTIDIVYSDDGFGSTDLVASELAFDAAGADWDVSALSDGAVYQVRAQSHLNPVIYDTSDAVFTI